MVSRSMMMTSPPISRPIRSTLIEADLGQRSLPPERGVPDGLSRGGDGGRWVLGDRLPPSAIGQNHTLWGTSTLMAADLKKLKQRACDAVDRHAPQLIETADWIHAHPEIGHQEVEASRRLAGMLQAAGVPVEMGTAGMATAFKAELPGNG